jgi:hypothetical protein
MNSFQIRIGVGRPKVPQKERKKFHFEELSGGLRFSSRA